MHRNPKTITEYFLANAAQKPKKDILKALGYLDTLYSFSGKIGHFFNEYDLATHIPGWPRPQVFNYSKPPIWPDGQLTPAEFWAFFWYALKSRNPDAPILSLLPPSPDGTGRVHEHIRKNEIQEWSRRISRAANEDLRRSQGSTPIQMRLVLSPQKFYFQWRPAEDAEFRNVRPGDIRNWKNYGKEIHFLDDASSVLYSVLADDYSSYQPFTINLYPQFKIFRIVSLIRSKQSRHAVVNAIDFAPIEYSDEPVRWSAQDLGENISIEATWRGQPIPEDKIKLDAGAQVSYLLTERSLLPCPHGAHLLFTFKSGRMVVPHEVFSSRESILWLHKVAGDLPPVLKPLLRIVKISPEFRFRLMAAGGGDSEFVCELFGKSPEGVPLAKHAEHTWQMLPKKGGSGTTTSPWIEIDPAGTEEAVLSLEPLKLKFDSYRGFWSARWGKSMVQRFAEWVDRWKGVFSIIAEGELGDFLYEPFRARITVDVREADNDWFDIGASLDFGDIELTPEEIRLLLKAKGDFVHLPGKGWRRLVSEIGEEEERQLANLGLSTSDLGGGRHRVHALQLANAADQNLLDEDAAQAVRKKIQSVKTAVDAAVPAGLTATLRPYQVEGFRFLAYLSHNGFGGLLADDMGLGKTVQALAWLLWLRQNEPGRPSLVVCPKSVIGVWKHETARFAPSIPASAVVEEGFDLEAAVRAGALVLANYAQLRLQASQLGQVHWQAAILDEAQAIKNPASQTALIARELRATHRLALTGTPVENRLLDIWSIYAFAMPGILGSRAAFKRNFSEKGDAWTTLRLSSRIKPFFLRRTKNQVATDLPPRTEEELSCEMEPTQHTIYQAELKRARRHLLNIKTNKEFDKGRFHLLTSLLRLRQICCHPALAGSDAFTGVPAKVQVLTEHLETVFQEGYKAVVFSQWVEMLALLEKPLEEQGWKVFTLTGQTEDRETLVKGFQNFEGPAVFLVSLKAGGSGLNLTAASYVYLFDPWWNPAVEAQAIDRTHRIGQEQPVFAYRLITKGTVEEKIRALQTKKRQIAEDVTGSGGFSEALSLEDFRFLLE